MKFVYPKWFPYPSSWLNAILLASLLGITAFVAEHTLKAGFRAAVNTDNPIPFVWMLFAAILSPIPTIACIHHLIHLFFTHFAPSLQAPEVGKAHGFIPGLFSWWEGIYGWAAIMISSMLTILIMLCTFPVDDVIAPSSLDWGGGPSESVIRFIRWMSACWIISTAYLYQLSHLVERRLINLGKKEGREQATATPNGKRVQ